MKYVSQMDGWEHKEFQGSFGLLLRRRDTCRKRELGRRNAAFQFERGAGSKDCDLSTVGVFWSEDDGRAEDFGSRRDGMRGSKLESGS